MSHNCVLKFWTFDQVAPPMMSDADIDAAQSCDGFVDRPTDLCRVGHIGDNRDGITSPADDLADNAIRALLVDVDTGHRSARLSKGQ
jgi:hypothetical protein